MYATTQMNLEDTMLSEISQMKKDKYWVPRGVKLRDRKQDQGYQGPDHCGETHGELLSKGFRISAQEEEMSFGDWFQNYVNLMSLNCTL